MNKFIACSKCINGYIYNINAYDEQVTTMCYCLKDFKYKQEFSLKLEKSNLPVNIVDYDISDYIGKDNNNKLKKIKEYINNFKEKFIKHHLYFYSKENSTQKTTLSSYIGLSLLKQGFSVYFILMQDLINILEKTKFEPDLEIYDILLKTDFLIIDDSFDMKKVTIYKSNYQIPFLDRFLRQRMEILKKATCFTSNVLIQDISNNNFSTDIQNLIDRNIHYECRILFEDSIHLKEDFNIEKLFESIEE